ncbi:unnamed protein product [Rotaria sordida]|uniref:N-acetylmuramoyl-L-alanine amidase domain-containing protein n=1 Tax=Rotaria sordida TaxID=392033 RepID=A0A814VSE4_9BILA|nr:unnamed protein product [Rotaria sordida]CAF1460895.1 unnamed protein product [Rotaria sordida]
MTYPTDSSPWAVSVGDFNNDTILDIVVANHDNDTVGIFLGWGNDRWCAISVSQKSKSKLLNCHRLLLAVIIRCLGGKTQVGLCPGVANIQCCSCTTCKDAAACRAGGGTPHGGICPGAANIQCCKGGGSTPTDPGTSKPINTMLTGLADILRGAGLNVVEVAGWKTRGHGMMSSVKGIIVHHTAGPATGDFPSLAVVRDGTSSLAGPLSQLGLGRTGTCYLFNLDESIDFLIENSEDWDSSIINDDDDDIGKRLLNI